MTYTATYSPEDNKLRLSASQRLDAETYARVKAAGFSWAPKQEIFVAPMWTPGRADLCMELAGEIGDEDTSLVERAEIRADRFSDYSEARADDAERAHAAVDRIADGIPLGQPILVGHHSERHARKDAERIENGMRKAVKMWETANYWKSRAAGAIAAAKYKELPAVRARRIKTIEADKRSHERDLERSQDFTKLWSVSLPWDPSVRRLTRENAAAIANYDHHVCSGKCFPLADFPRDPPASQYEGAMGLWSALTDNVITPEQARDFALAGHKRTIAHAERWLEHINNRLEYERAMLAEAGGTAADKFDVQVGGRVLIHDEWCIVLRVNKAGGRVNSVTTNARYVGVRGIEEVKDYRAPEPEELAQVKAATKQAPLCNFKVEGCAEMTAEAWKQRTKHSDSWWVQNFKETETTGAYRMRTAPGGGARNYERVPVFLTDAKVTPAPLPSGAPKPEPIKRVRALPKTAATIDQVTPDMFNTRAESGKIIAGIKYEYSGEGESECYQFDFLEDLLDCARSYQQQPRMLRFSLVTHTGEYKNMRTVFKWERPMDGSKFEALKDTLRAGVQVVSAPQLFPTPPELAARMVEIADVQPMERVLEPSAGTGNIIAAIREVCKSAPITAVELSYTLAEAVRKRFDIPVKAGDFMECNGDLGKFDVILMNPPFSDGQDIAHIKHALGMLAPGGRLVAICANGPRQQDRLKPIIMERGGEWEELPADTFKSAGTGVRTVLISVTEAN